MRQVYSVAGHQRGKVIAVHGVWVFYRDVSERVRIRFLDGWAIEKSLVEELKRMRVVAVHYFDREEDVLYAASLDTIEQKGVLRDMNGRPQYLLPRRYWEQRERSYEPRPWVVDQRDVPARR